MNIHWLSPLDPQQTEIGRYTQLLLSDLRRRFALLAVTDSAEIHDTFECDRKIVGMAPVNIYNIGNSHLHCGILNHAMIEPGVVILHDVSLLELALAFARETQTLNLTELVRDEYGVRAGDDFDKLYGGPGYQWHGESQEQYDAFVTAYQVFSTFISNAYGVVVHSQYAFERVANKFDGPVVRLNLPYRPPVSLDSPRRSGKPPYSILFCGHAGPNRRLRQFIEAWGQVSQPECFRLAMYGNIGKSDEILARAAELGLAAYIDLVGFVEEEVLEDAIRGSDLALNLRFPTMGEASASQLRFWSHGIPTIVCDVGWYGELPDDVVMKVAAADEQAGIAAILEALLADAGSFVEVGENGYRYLLEQHSPEAYVEGLHQFVESVAQQRFMNSVFDDRLVDVLASMCEDVHDSMLFEATLAKLSSMVENPQSS